MKYPFVWETKPKIRGERESWHSVTTKAWHVPSSNFTVASHYTFFLSFPLSYVKQISRQPVGVLYIINSVPHVSFFPSQVGILLTIVHEETDNRDMLLYCSQAISVHLYIFPHLHLSRLTDAYCLPCAWLTMNETL